MSRARRLSGFGGGEFCEWGRGIKGGKAEKTADDPNPTPIYPLPAADCERGKAKFASPAEKTCIAHQQR
jgi:hypothetical protein